MTPHALFKARIVWSCLLELDETGTLNWQAWAEKTILKTDFSAPFWLGELTAAPSAHAALQCVREGIELEYVDFPTDDIDEESFVFGLLYSRFARHEECAKEAWRMMADVGDPATYAASGHWRKYQRDPDVDISGMPLEALMPAVFRPLAAYALSVVRQTLGTSAAPCRSMKAARCVKKSP